MWSSVKEYAPQMEFFASNIQRDIEDGFAPDEAIFALREDPEKDYYLLEFNEGQPYAVGLWDPEEGVLSLYTGSSEEGYTLEESRAA